MLKRCSLIIRATAISGLIGVLSSCVSNQTEEFPQPLAGSSGVATSLALDWELNDPHYETIDPMSLNRLGEYYIVDQEDVEFSELRNFLLYLDQQVGPVNSAMMCFNPRHAIQYDSALGERVTVLVCFECKRVLISSNGYEQVRYLANPNRGAIDSLFREYGVTLPRNPKR